MKKREIRRCPSTVSCTVPSCEIANSWWIPAWEPNSQGNGLKALLRGISLSKYGSEGFRVRLRRLSEYGSVAYLVERPNTGRTVLGHRPRKARFKQVDALQMCSKGLACSWRRCGDSKQAGRLAVD